MKHFESECLKLHKESDKTFMELLELIAERNRAEITQDEFLRHRDMAIQGERYRRAS